MTSETATRLFVLNVRSRVFSECPDVVNNPAMTKAISKVFKDISNRETFLSAIFLDAQACCHYLLVDFCRLSEKEQVMVSGKTRNEWLKFF